MDRSAARFWLGVASTCAVIAAVLTLIGAPSAFLFAGVLTGALWVFRSRAPRALPLRFQRFGLATVGIAAGSQIDSEVISTVLDQPAQILGCVFVTMVVTMLCGQVLRLSKEISSTTALFASIAGAAAGVTAVVREAGGDDAVVMAIQYLRVVAVVVTVPIAAGILGGTNEPATDAPVHQAWDGFTFTVVALLLGLTLAHFLSFSASTLVLPLLVAMGLSLADALSPAVVPTAILAVGYAAIGLMVGLSMTPQVVRLLMRILPLALLQLVLTLSSCAALGLAMARFMHVSDLDGYLIATPGGLPAVAAIAIGSGATVGLVVTVQLVRVFLALVLASALAEWITRRDPGTPPPPTARRPAG